MEPSWSASGSQPGRTIRHAGSLWIEIQVYRQWLSFSAVAVQMMNNLYFHSYLHRQIPVLIWLSVLPGLGYVFLSWMHGIPLRAVLWYAAILAVSGWGYLIYRQFQDESLSSVQLKAWYKQLSLFYYVFFFLWLVIFLLFIPEHQYNLHYPLDIFLLAMLLQICIIYLEPQSRSHPYFQMI